MIKLNTHKKLWSSTGDYELHADLGIPKGEIVAFYGDSGTGKTTLLRTLAGLTNSDSGVVTVNNNVWFDSTKKINLPANKRNVGFVFQDYGLFPNMTVKENIRFAQESYDSEYLNYLLKIFDLNELKNRKPDKLSGGQKQRVALARAIAKKPDILLLDEPLSALDNKTRISLQDEIRLINNTWGITIIIVSHDISEIFKLCSRVYHFQNGYVIDKGIPSNLFSKQQISGKVQFVGEVIECEKEDIVQILTLLIGNTPVKVVISNPDEKFVIGEKVLVASKAFSPIVEKIS